MDRSGLGILGGTFDPPHIGHQSMARTTYERLNLERVLVVPSFVPPHKMTADMSEYADRFEMTRLMVENEDGIELSALDAERPGPSYTVDLLKSLRGESSNELYFIVGSDSLADMHNWREPEAIMSLCTLVVFTRSGFEPVLKVHGDASIVVFEDPVIDVSSSELRSLLRTDYITAAKSLHPRVLEYIRQRGLYR
jgi:nicotinate-nucleotide adenylyltransferase